jgi:Mrp family chromosome partitioning ATPase
MAADATNGLFEVLAGKAELDAAIRTMRGLAFLPTIIAPGAAHGSELLGSEALKLLVERLRETYDYIIIDLPPLGPVAEVRSTASLVDCYVQVIEWGRSRKNTVRQQLLGAPEIHERLLGVVLNKVDLREFGRHEGLDAADGQHGYY